MSIAFFFSWICDISSAIPEGHAWCMHDAAIVGTKWNRHGLTCFGESCVADSRAKMKGEQI
jgi:hypothetical protein